MKLKLRLFLGFLLIAVLANAVGYLPLPIEEKQKPVVLLFIVLILTGTWAMFFSSFILKRLTELKEVVAEITQGNLSKRIIVKSKDEIGQLCLHFNEMVNRLQQENQLLETKVRERTGEIEVLKTSLEEKVKERTSQLEALKVSLEKTVENRAKELNEKVAVLEKLNKILVGREIRMVELKKEIEELKSKLNSYTSQNV